MATDNRKKTKESKSKDSSKKQKLETVGKEAEEVSVKKLKETALPSPESGDEKYKSIAKEKKQKTKKKNKATDTGNLSSDNDGKEESQNANTKKRLETQTNPKESDVADKDVDSGEDDDLLEAAAAWAEQNNDDAMKEANETTTTEVAPKKSFSLHITQLPFDANELDIRQLFADKGCIITSIRLVYDRDEQGRKTLFRGVAFVDMLDEKSYSIALKLNRSTVRGRKLNIRPTRSKEELATIVTKTQEMVKAKIQEQKGAPESTPAEKAKSAAQKKKAKKQEKKAKKKANKVKHKAPGEAKDSATAKKKKETDHKLTKKERNRKAAIILGLHKRKRN